MQIRANTGRNGYEFLHSGKRMTIVSIDGDKCKFKNSDFRKGGSGFGMSEQEVSYTLSIRDRHMVYVHLKE